MNKECLGRQSPLDWDKIHEALSAPFNRNAIDFLVKGKGEQVMALPFIDARAAMNRLDEVVGNENWSYDWSVVVADDKMVAVKSILTVLSKTKSDAGEAAKEDEAIKSAVSDGLKRAGVHFGIGRYLYAIPQIWVKSKKVTRNGQDYFSIADKNEAYTALEAFLSGKPPSTPKQRPPQSGAKPEQQSTEPDVTCEWPGCDKQIRGYKSKTGKVYTTEDVVNFSRKDCVGKAYCYDHCVAFKEGKRPDVVGESDVE
ncbi:MAG: Rad52/Rad22 family DNA repair protein [Dehalococcoidia bacterium]|jgi:hypothetical protein